MRNSIVLSVAMAIMFGSLASEAPAQEGVAERIGRQLDRGAERLGRELRRGWAEIRQSIDELGVQGRVYGRLHWDKAINSASIDVQVHDEAVIVLTGTLPDEETRDKAVQLAQDTVGVRDVVDRLQVAPPNRSRSATSGD